MPRPGVDSLYMKRLNADLDPKSPRYGCIRQFGDYMHGDYDLYAIVPFDDPSTNLVAYDIWYDLDHYRGKYFYEVQTALKAGFGGIPMVRHGEQEEYKHCDEAIDIFWPEPYGKITVADGLNAVEELYRTTFHGRRAANDATRPKDVGRFQRI